MEKTMVKLVVPLQPMERTTLEQISTLQPMEDPFHYRSYALKEAAAHGEPVLEQAPGRNCSLWRIAHAGADFLAGIVAHGEEPMLEQSIPEGLYPMERTRAGVVREGLYPMGWTPRWSRGKV
ncbi:zinc finger and BTB domain-containing protein 5 [Grus japonensis]|uniref:Zinc finger and BTB domain-containing protein 5 n=1 Tax=Grus japonensis TaxID=30415 RepID=A0ABC9YDR5_GRUJA